MFDSEEGADIFGVVVMRQDVLRRTVGVGSSIVQEEAVHVADELLVLGDARFGALVDAGTEGVGWCPRGRRRVPSAATNGQRREVWVSAQTMWGHLLGALRTWLVV